MAVVDAANFSISLGSDDPTVTYSGEQGNARTAFTTRIPSLIGLVPERSQWGVALSSLTIWRNPAWQTAASDVFVGISLIQSSIIGSQVTQVLAIMPVEVLFGGASAQTTFYPAEGAPQTKSTTTDLRYATSVSVTLTDSFGNPLAPLPAYNTVPLTEFVTRIDLKFVRLA